MFDTGLNVQETVETLELQQERLLAGKRSVQMFPAGTTELPLPEGLCRVENHRGVFHYDPAKITKERVLELSLYERENEFLELGPFSKLDILGRLKKGERLETVVEYTPTGVEVRAAIGTAETVEIQKAYFERTKDPENGIYTGMFPHRVLDKLEESKDAIPS